MRKATLLNTGLDHVQPLDLPQIVHLDIHPSFHLKHLLQQVTFSCLQYVLTWPPTLGYSHLLLRLLTPSPSHLAGHTQTQAGTFPPHMALPFFTSMMPLLLPSRYVHHALMEGGRSQDSVQCLPSMEVEVASRGRISFLQLPTVRYAWNIL